MTSLRRFLDRLTMLGVERKSRCTCRRSREYLKRTLFKKRLIRLIRLIRLVRLQKQRWC